MATQDHYRQTLHLPQTDFPMKARLSEREPKIIKQWSEHQIHKKILEKRKNSKPFFLPDGPPYSNGAIHIGHALNKILKDIVIKYKNLRGFKARFLPSWDCHGLPIELKALKKRSEKAHRTSKGLRQLCREEARFWMEKQKQSFKRLGVLADWDHPLLTMDSDYEAGEVRAFARMVQKGLIYRGTKPVFWCFKLQTALAFSEAEYREHKSPSVYVSFDLDSAGEKKLNSPQPVSAVIWTTTPWTLPANSAICLHPDLKYGLYKGEKKSYLLACERAEAFFKETGLPSLPKQQSFKGRELEGLVSLHPFMDRASPLVLGDHVRLEAGTGLVHTAPGHGLEDHLVGKKYQLKAYCPVDEKGHFTKELPEELRGLFIFKGNQVIVELLKSSGHLVSHKEIIHSYPYNPRSDSPLIYRLTPQWFLSLDKQTQNGLSIRSKALEACEKSINFIPDWGKARLEAMIQTSPDWCLSRQRTWGVPLVVFYCRNCSAPLLDSKIIEKIADEMKASGEGIEYYFSKTAEELLPKDLKCGDCASQDFQKGKDILDVWFDSGIQHFVFAKKKEPEWTFPADLFLEGSDQHRGWFQTSLLSSLALNSAPPFKTLLTHGFVNDKQGRKMSKSKGNVLDSETMIKKNGAEILRLWVASENFSFDVSAGEEGFQRVTESYRRFRNIFRFILGNLNDFDPVQNLLEFKDLNAVDQWMLGQLNLLIKNSLQAFDEFTFHKVYQQLNHFFTVKLSAFYLDIIKDRLYTFSKHSLERKKAQTVLYQLIDQLLPLMAPITSFLSEEAYFYLPKKIKESVFLEDYPEVVSEWWDEGIQNLFSQLFPLRSELNKQLEALRKKGDIGSNLQARAKITLETDFITPALSEQERLEFFSVSQLVIEEGKRPHLTAEPAQGEKCLRCWFVSKNLNEKGICLKCVQNLNER